MKSHIRLHLILKPFRNSKYRPLLLAAGLLLGGCNALPAWCAESAGSRVPAALEEAKKLPGLPECTGQMPLVVLTVGSYREDSTIARKVMSLLSVILPAWPYCSRRTRHSPQ